MSDMDMIPVDFRQGLHLKRQLRHFVMAGVLLLGAAALARAVLGYLTWREQAVVVRFEQQQQQLDHDHVQTAELREQQQVTQQQLAALEQLRGRNRVALLLRALDEAYSENIWLDGVHFARRGGTGAETTLQVSQGAELFGHATSHSVLAEFMQHLGAQPAVSDMRLINTAARAYADRQVIDFNLSLRIQEQARVRP